MPLGFERLNERTQRPNVRINFIKPIATASPADKAIAQDFLERIAAQCYPVMKRDHISVMSLEEYPPNPEFLGRNFNAGEVIQLVLKDKSGRWLSFNFVQMVMMHELAHCKQMNHSRFFWQVRNRYADHMKDLWKEKYTGEGMWGKGRSLTTGHFVHDRVPDRSDVPEHLCGGTYRRRRGTKRKRGQESTEKPKLSYAERQQKRIAKKFGIHGEGQGLGEDELVRGAIETFTGGKRSYGKPRVANSKRGRELRANAALARLELGKRDPGSGNIKSEGDETDLDWSDDDRLATQDLTFDRKKIKDEHGEDLFLVCGNEAEQDDGAQDEMDDLRRMRCNDDHTVHDPRPGPNEEAEHVTKQDYSARKESSETVLNGHASTTAQPDRLTHKTSVTESEYNPKAPVTIGCTESVETYEPEAHKRDHGALQTPLVTCPICSLENTVDAATCIACAHVLKPALMPGHWRCTSTTCRATAFINATDVGRCGICGLQKPQVDPGKSKSSRPTGTVQPEILRWD